MEATLAKQRTTNWLALIAVPIALIPLILAGLWAYMHATITTLHPDPIAVPSVALSAGAPKWAKAVEQSRQAVRAALAEQNLPGLSVAVGIDEDLLWAEGFGWADLEKRTPVAPETRFRIGTASVALTSAAAGLLLEGGRLKLDEPIQKYVPAFPEKKWPVTVRQIMGHVAGVRNDGGDEGPLFSERCAKPVEAFPHFADRPLLFEPGTKFRFSSYGWIVVSAAIEAAAGEPFLTFMQKHVFAPLGMESTIAESATDEIPNRATFYFPRYGADPRYGLHLMRDLDYSCYAGASVFLSTPSDLVRFGTAIQRGKLLRHSTVQTLQTPQRLASGEETGYGLGWDLETVSVAGKQARVVGHDGDSLGGMAASLMAIPDRGIVVSVMSNISYADTAGAALKIAEAFNQPSGKP